MREDGSADEGKGQGTTEEDGQADKRRQVGEEDGDIVGGVQGIYI